jgi:pimeloyl-ACP methyl ester carboxylesterase
MVLNTTAPILLLHGLGGRVWTMALFVSFLSQLGFTNVYTPQWPSVTCDMPGECINALAPQLDSWLNGSRDTSFVVIGNSMGGVLAYYLPRWGYNVSKAFYVATPLNGSRAVQWMNKQASFGQLVAEQAVGEGSWFYLSQNHYLAPPGHAYWTMTRSLLDLGDDYRFDGHVFHKEAVIESDRDVHGSGGHFDLAFNPFFWRQIVSRLHDPPRNFSSINEINLSGRFVGEVALMPVVLLLVLYLFLQMVLAFCRIVKRHFQVA